MVFGEPWSDEGGESDSQIGDWVKSLGSGKVHFTKQPFESFMRGQLDYYDQIMFDEGNAQLIGAPWLPNQYLETLINRLKNYIEDVIRTR